jgi:hypothetical protein
VTDKLGKRASAAPEGAVLQCTLDHPLISTRKCDG